MRLLLTGADGFTGRHLSCAARAAGYEVFELQGDLQDVEGVKTQVARIAPTHVIHLAGLSQVTGEEQLAYYGVNLLGSINLLNALSNLPKAPQKVILASSANVYGNTPNSPITELQAPTPVSHYAMSKLAMEYMSQPFLDRLPIVILRPFNYTGLGHAPHFIIPKIVDHAVQRASSIELGNLDVLREYNDVRDVCEIYLRLLIEGVSGETYNVASGRSYSLHQVLQTLEKISGHCLQTKLNPQFLRSNEIFELAGDPSKLERCIGPILWRSLDDTLGWMYQKNPS
jgi:nucleoside-diphosphate-sugar epimerase